jgi:hypothetical protein
MTFQSMLAQMSGSGNAAPADPSSSTPPTPPPPTVSANGADLPPQTATAGPMPPAAENASFQQMLSQMSGQPADGNTPPDPNAAPAKGGFVQGLGEGSGLGGVKQAVVGAAQDNKAQGERALDIYHQMIAAHAKGDSKTAAELAGNLSMLVTRQGLQKAYAPLLEAAKMVILDPVKAVQEQRAADKNATPSGKELDAQEAQLKSVWNRVKQDWESKNPDRADQVLTDVLHGTVGQPAMNAIPLVGPMISSMANNLDEASHAPGGEDRGRVLGNAIGAGGMALAGEAAGALGDFLPGAKGSVKAGLAEGQAGADAAQSVADTAHAHDTILQANKDKFQQQLDASVDKAQKAKEAQTQVKNDNKVEAGNQTKERTDAHNDLVTSARDAQHEHIDQTLDNATDQYGQQFKQSLHSAVISGVDSEDMATRVNKGINQYEGRAHADFENGMSGGSPRNPTSDSVLGQLQGKTVPAKGSPFQEMAAEKLKKPDPEDHAYTGDAADLAHANIDPKLEAKLQDWSEGIQTVEGKGPADTAGKPTTVDLKKGVGDFTAPQLVKIRQYLRKAAEGYPRGDVNRGIVMDMLKATDDTMGKLAEKNP